VGGLNECPWGHYGEKKWCKKLIYPLEDFAQSALAQPLQSALAQPLQSALAQPLQSALAQPLSPLRGDEIFKGVVSFFLLNICKKKSRIKYKNI
jgi:hypothetical protein